MNSAKPIYRLGHINFSLSHAESDFERVLARLFTACNRASITETNILDLQMGLSLDIDRCLQVIIEQHHDCLIVQAACLALPDGRTVLLAGDFGSGKTTLALALALGYGWKVVAENLLLLDATTRRLLSLAAPFQLKEGVREQLHLAGVELPGFILREWFPLSEALLANDCPARFDVAIFLEAKFDAPDLSFIQCTTSEFTRKVLPLSNLLQKRGTNIFVDALPEHHCYTTSGGTFKQRLAKVLALCEKLPHS